MIQSLKEPMCPLYRTYPTKRRKCAKINKGLRHFSMKVCQKVEEKNVTSYNEVADELVREFVTSRPNDAVRVLHHFIVHI